jgi:hypothetical protein
MLFCSENTAPTSTTAGKPRRPAVFICGSPEPHPTSTPGRRAGSSAASIRVRELSSYAGAESELTSLAPEIGEFSSGEAGKAKYLAFNFRIALIMRDFLARLFT